MDLLQATQIITSALAVTSGIIQWAGPWINPLDPNATFVTWMVALSVVVPLAFTVFNRFLRLVSG